MNKHPHAEAIDRLGRKRIKDHFNISSQAIHLWTINGVPRMHRNSIRMLAMLNGVPVPELNEVEA